MTTIPLAVDLNAQAHECGRGNFALSSGTREVRFGGRAFPIEQNFFVCSGCGETRQTLTQMGDARRAAAKLARQTQGLLAPHEVRDIRETRLHVSQAVLENALGLGAKTVIRWETGKVLQPKATDNLLRVLDHEPSLLLFLAERNGVSLPAGVVQSLLSSSQPISIPKRFLEEIQGIAAAQGVDARDYALWVLAEHISELKAESKTETVD